MKFWALSISVALLLALHVPHTAAQESPDPSGRLIFTDFDPSYGAYLYDLDTNMRFSLPFTEFNDLGWYWTVDSSTIFVDLCFRFNYSYPGPLACLSHMIGIYNSEQGSVFDTIASIDRAWENDRSVPTLSPDGNRIAFARQISTLEGYRVDILLANADGTNIRTLPADGSFELTWSPNSSFLAFACEDYSAICIFDVSTSESIQIDHNADAQVRELSWSPDGNFLAFDSVRDDGASTLYIVAKDGSDQQNLTEANFIGLFSPVWSPDSTQLAFGGYIATFTGCCGQVFAINADGTNLRNLSNNDNHNAGPVWSPDSTHLAFFAYQDNGPVCLSIIAYDGSDLRCVTENSQVGLVDVSWPALYWLP